MKDPYQCKHQLDIKHIFWGKRRNRGNKERIAITQCRKCGWIIQVIFNPLRPINEEVQKDARRNKKISHKPKNTV